MTIKKNLLKCISAAALLCFSLQPLTGLAAAPAAAPVAVNAAAATVQPIVQKIRYSQGKDKVRIVIDMTNVPEYSVNYDEAGNQLQVSLPNTLLRAAAVPLPFPDPVVGAVNLSADTAQNVTNIQVQLKKKAEYKVFKLPSPNRLVIDVLKEVEEKTTENLADGVQYTYWSRPTAAGRITAHIVALKSQAAYRLRPVLANGVVVDLETVSSMAQNSKALAAVNGSYFAPSGEIIGLLKMDGEIVSIPELPRTVLGIFPDGKYQIGVTDYTGTVTLPDGRSLAIGGVNCERGPDALVLYTGYYDSTTDTNNFGTEYIISNGTVTAVNVQKGNAPIPPGGMVLSAHGSAEKALAGLKVGDKVGIKQSLGSEWDKATHVVGAGPTLVKNGSVSITAKLEQFPADIAVGRAPRTAVGLTKDGQVLLVVVDGRQAHSIGMSLLELALFMQELGAVDAMNFDGGGSSEMVVNAKVMNKPSDGRERRVGDALAIVPTKLAN